jgi:hypothetical protein
MTNTKKLALTLMVATIAMVGSAEAKSKTKRAAETAVKVLPMSKPAKTLMKVNIRIYDRMGWEAGRLISTMEHGPSGDPGKYPGYNH